MAPSTAQKAHSSARATFASRATLPLEFRQEQLLALRALVLENEGAIENAIRDDFGKPKFETAVTETALVLHDIKTAVDNLAAWMAPESVARGLPNAMDACEVRRDPRGCTLILGAWNYPIQLTLVPLVGAIAGGCTAVVKPSELAPKTAELLGELFPKYLDRNAYVLVNGGVDVAKDLLDLRWDFVFFTGSTAIGKVVALKCAETLTPNILELGGKSPCVVTKCASPRAAAQRILWGRCLNAGQSCIAVDYILVTEDMHEPLVDALKEAIATFYGTDDGRASLSKIVNERHFDRLAAVLKATKGNVVAGGGLDRSSRTIEPTVITNVSPDDSTMKEELFGPILPILKVPSVDKAIDFINAREKPLALYVFGDDASVAEHVLNATTSGSAVVNDALVQAGVNTLPFGGIGHSGVGAYHGHYSFKAFTHEKAVLRKSLGMEFINDATRYPPYNDSKLAKIKFALGWPFAPAVSILKRPFIWAFGAAAAATAIVRSQK